MSDRSFWNLHRNEVPPGDLLRLHRQNYRREMQDALNNVDAALMSTLGSEEEDSVNGFFLHDLESTHLGEMFNMVCASLEILSGPDFVAVHDERTPHIQGSRIQFLQAIRTLLLERNTDNAQEALTRMNLEFLETVEGTVMPTEGPQP